MSVRVIGRVGSGWMEAQDGSIRFGQHWDAAKCRALASELEKILLELRERGCEEFSLPPRHDGHVASPPHGSLV